MATHTITRDAVDMREDKRPPFLSVAGDAWAVTAAVYFERSIGACPVRIVTRNALDATRAVKTMSEGTVKTGLFRGMTACT